MKNIKVFIASSAELDEDKTQFDLYFAQKNKVYSKRYITFEQKTRYPPANNHRHDTANETYQTIFSALVFLRK